MGAGQTSSSDAGTDRHRVHGGSAEGAHSVRRRTADDIVRLLPMGVMTFQFAAPDRFVLMDANAVAAAMVLEGRSGWVGMPLEELWPPRMVQETKPALLETARMGTPYESEVVLRGEDGIRHALRMHGFAIPEGRVVIAFEEIAEQRRAEESLARSEAKFRGLVEDLADAVFAADPQGVLTYVSPAVTPMLGYRPEEMVGRSYREFAPAGMLPSVAELESMFASTPPTAPLDFAVAARGGGTVWVRVSAHIVRDALGEMTGIQGVFSDITARRRVEDALETTRQDMELVLNATSDYLAYYAPDLTVRWVNRAAAAAAGKDERDIVGMQCRDVWTCAHQGGGDCAVLRAFETGRPCESRVRTQEGRAFVVRAYPAFAGTRLVGVVESTVDITVSQRAREDRERIEAQLRQSQKLESIGTLASGIAHEVNNPLTGMVNYAELIATRVDDDRLREFAVGIQQEGARVAAIVRNLLSFARKDSGQTTAAHVAQLVQTTLMLIRALLDRDGIDVRIDMPDDLPPVACHPQQIEQVLLNVLTNARDALNERFAERPSPDKWLAVRARELDQGSARCVRLTVEDNGTGIPEAIRDRVLDPFFTTKPRDRGTGLGLSISYGIVRDHGGRLWIEHGPASGGATALHVDLPVATGLHTGEREAGIPL
jgi:PAS domain S-box-containing protein